MEWKETLVKIHQRNHRIGWGSSPHGQCCKLLLNSWHVVMQHNQNKTEKHFYELKWQNVNPTSLIYVLKNMLLKKKKITNMFSGTQELDTMGHFQTLN